MHPSIIKNFIFPLHEWLLGRDTLACLEELEKTQWYSKQQLEDLQFIKIKALLQHAQENVPYYKGLFAKSNFVPEKMKSSDDFQKVPFLTKNDIRKNTQDMIASNAKKLTQWSTGGSTGHPLIFYVDNERIACDIAAKIRSRRWWGVDIGDRELCFWGSPIEINAQSRLKKVRDKFINTRLLSVYDLTKDSMNCYVQILKKFRPKHIFGYGTGLYIFARFILENKVNLNDINIKVIFSTAEVLSDYKREIIEETFNCPVADGYGGRDGGFITHECPQKQMHISSDQLYIEIINGDRPAKQGEEGEIVVTNFHSYGMPFIRYKMGDIAVLSETSCSCGRHLPVLKKLLGRSQDVIITEEGRIIHWVFFMKLIEGLKGIEQFRVVQKGLDKICIDIVKNSLFESVCVQMIVDKIKQNMGENTDVEINFPQHIPMEKSGKFKWIISELNAEKIFGDSLNSKK